MFEINAPLSTLSRVSREIHPQSPDLKEGNWAAVVPGGKLYRASGIGVLDTTYKLVIGHSSAPKPGPGYQPNNMYESNDVKAGRITTLESPGVSCKCSVIGYMVGPWNHGDLLAVHTDEASAGMLFVPPTPFQNDLQFVARADNSSSEATHLEFTTIEPIKYLGEHAVVYYGNGNDAGDPPTDPNFYHNGDTVTVLDNTGNLTKTGFDFDGWTTQAEGGGSHYQPGETFVINTNAFVILYAKWVESEEPLGPIVMGGNLINNQE